MYVSFLLSLSSWDLLLVLLARANSAFWQIVSSFDSVSSPLGHGSRARVEVLIYNGFCGISSSRRTTDAPPRTRVRRDGRRRIGNTTTHFIHMGHVIPSTRSRLVAFLVFGCADRDVVILPRAMLKHMIDRRASDHSAWINFALMRPQKPCARRNAVCCVISRVTISRVT